MCEKGGLAERPVSLLALLALSFLAVLLGPGTAQAQEAFQDYRRVGKAQDELKSPDPLNADGHILDPTFDYKFFDVMTPHAWGAETLGYTDNLFDDPSNPAANDTEHPVSTPYSRTVLGIRDDIQLHHPELGDDVFTIAYHAADSYYFNTSSDRNIFEDGVDTRGDLNFNDWAVHADASWAHTAFPQQIQVSGLDFADQINAEGWVEAAWNRLGFKVGGMFAYEQFIDSSLLRGDDNKSFGGNAQVNFRIFEKFNALAEYDFTYLRFNEDQQPGFEAHAIQAGVNGEITPTISCSAKLGWTIQIPELSSQFTDHHRYNGFTGALSASWAIIPDKLTLSAGYKRDLTWGDHTNYETDDNIDVGLQYTFGPDQKFRLQAGCTYDHGTVDSGDHVDRIQARFLFGYKVQRWLDATISYTYSQELGSASFSVDTYSQNKVEASVAVGF